MANQRTWAVIVLGAALLAASFLWGNARRGQDRYQPITQAAGNAPSLGQQIVGLPEDLLPPTNLPSRPTPGSTATKAAPHDVEQGKDDPAVPRFPDAVIQTYQESPGEIGIGYRAGGTPQTVLDYYTEIFTKDKGWEAVGSPSSAPDDRGTRMQFRQSATDIDVILFVAAAVPGRPTDPDNNPTLIFVAVSHP